MSPRYDGGWVKLWRSAWASDLSSNSTLWSIWTALLTMAIWRESKILWDGEQRILPPGSVVFGISEFADKWGLSKNTVSRWVSYLHKTGRIVNETGTRGCVATICNWADYQGFDEDSGTIQEREENTDGTPTERDENLNEEVQEGKKRRRKEYICAFDLEEAYCIYPLKKGKSRGLKTLAKEIQSQEAYDSLLSAIDRYSQTEEVSRGFTKHFSTFANEWRDWSDPDAGTSSVPGAGQPVNFVDMISSKGGNV